MYAIICAICFLSVNAESHIYAANRNAGKYVALTFDDGPHPAYTEKILDILKKNNAKATFFVIGKNAECYPEILRKVHESGNEIGNHTYSHPDMKKIAIEKAADEILKTQDIIYNITGKKPKLFRAPGGIFSDELVCAVEDMDYKPILWSWRQDTKDWSLPKVENVVKNVMKNLQDGDIILFHDYNVKGSPTPKALELLLPLLKEKGYTTVTVSELLEISSEKECDG
jgi:polysaccharide deacetylase family sporulation protein PdaB